MMIDCSHSRTKSNQIMLPSCEMSPATDAVEKLSWLPRREQHRRRVNSAPGNIPSTLFDSPEACAGSDLSKQRNEAFDMSALFTASQNVDGCMEFPSIKWTSDGEEEAKRFVSKMSSSYTDTFLGASDIILPLPLRSSSTSSLSGKRRRSSKKLAASHRLVRSIALDSDLSSLVDWTRLVPADSRNATFSHQCRQQRSSNPATSIRIEECMKILKESELLAATDHHSSKKQRNHGDFHILQE